MIPSYKKKRKCELSGLKIPCFETDDLFDQKVLELRDNNEIEFGVVINYAKSDGEKDYYFISNCMMCGAPFELREESS